MQKINFFLSLLICSNILLAQNSNKSLIRTGSANVISFDEGWLFKRYGLQAEGGSIPEPENLQSVNFQESSWQKVDLPHDFAIHGPFRVDLSGETGKLPYQGIAWYRKHFTVSGKDANKHVYIDFDGAMAYAKVWLNGHYIGTWPYGYSSFRMDLTPFLKFDSENILAVQLNTEKWQSRWYSGAGIYRHVWLVKTNDVHVGHWGAFITTPQVSESSALVNANVTIDNTGKIPVDAIVKTDVFELNYNDVIGKKVSSFKQVNVTIENGKSAAVSSEATVLNPKLWDVTSPNRYLAQTTIIVNGKVVDTYNSTFGIRTIEFTHNNGFLLNGKRVQIQGVCNHHDLGALGAAVNTSALERQMKILKEMGCNAIRTSHNPPSPELLDVADKLGMLIMDEAFDCWTLAKKENDYNKLYKDWHEKDLQMLVCRDRNHPSIILWSTGNEVEEQYRPELGVTQHLTDVIHKYDTTRPVTFGASWPSKSAMNGTELQVDVHGMNYAAGGYGGPDFYGNFLSKPGHEKLAGFSSESASTVSSRGEYFFGRNTGNWQVTSYDLVQPGWGALVDQEFRALCKYPAICGEFVWTGFDYLGEPTPFNSDETNLLNFRNDPAKRAELEKKLEEIRKNNPPSRSSYFGIVDIAGFPKDRYYLYQAHWRPDFPVAHILPHWNWPERVGLKTPVFVYTSGDEAELFLNGKSLGKRTKKLGIEFRLKWDSVLYVPGTLKVVAYKNGKRWAADSVKTTEDACKLTLSANNKSIKNDGTELCYITVAVKDKNDLTVPRSKPLIKFSIVGDGEIVATDNGDATSFIPFQSHTRSAFNGLALVIVKAKKGAKGSFIVKAESDGLVNSQIKINIRKSMSFR